MNYNERAIRMLRWLGVAPHLKGYTYLLDAIEMSLDLPINNHVMTKQLYPRLASKYNVSASSIERCIRHAIQTTWRHSPTDVFNRAFGNTYNVERGAPTNSLFIATAVNLLKEECILY